MEILEILFTILFVIGTTLVACAIMRVLFYLIDRTTKL